MKTKTIAAILAVALVAMAIWIMIFSGNGYADKDHGHDKHYHDQYVTISHTHGYTAMDENVWDIEYLKTVFKDEIADYECRVKKDSLLVELELLRSDCFSTDTTFRYEIKPIWRKGGEK